VLLTLLLAAGFIGLDQLAKLWAKTVLQPVGTLPGIKPIFRFTYVENTGAAFNIFEDMRPFLIVVTIIALLVLAYVLIKKRPKDRLEWLALVCIFAGGAGNLIDRIVQGYVVDLFQFTFVNFAVFNVADIFVVGGVLLLAISMIRIEIRAAKARKTKESACENEDVSPSSEA
jgi:signal peptidase II